jgi:hypothetical protein
MTGGDRGHRRSAVRPSIHRGTGYRRGRPSFAGDRSRACSGAIVALRVHRPPSSRQCRLLSEPIRVLLASRPSRSSRLNFRSINLRLTAFVFRGPGRRERKRSALRSRRQALARALVVPWSRLNAAEHAEYAGVSRGRISVETIVFRPWRVPRVVLDSSRA